MHAIYREPQSHVYRQSVTTGGALVLWLQGLSQLNCCTSKGVATIMVMSEKLCATYCVLHTVSNALKYTIYSM